jgi:hypothetical protein
MLTRPRVPRRHDRLKQRRIAQQLIDRRQIRRQLGHLHRQPEIEQTLHLRPHQTKHLPSNQPICRMNRLNSTRPDGTADYFRGK